MGINLQEYSSELRQYSCMLEAHLDWQGREGYLKLLENFQKGKIQDFEFLFLMKDKDSYVFTSDRKPNQKLRRETITMDVNKVTHSVSKSLPSKPNITSHSFRIGYISRLWKDTKDIEFVRQTIGHRNLNSTSGYVSEMGDQERQDRISRINIT